MIENPFPPDSDWHINRPAEQEQLFGELNQSLTRCIARSFQTKRYFIAMPAKNLAHYERIVTNYHDIADGFTYLDLRNTLQINNQVTPAEETYALTQLASYMLLNKEAADSAGFGFTRLPLSDQRLEDVGLESMRLMHAMHHLSTAVLAESHAAWQRTKTHLQITYGDRSPAKRVALTVIEVMQRTVQAPQFQPLRPHLQAYLITR